MEGVGSQNAKATVTLVKSVCILGVVFVTITAMAVAEAERENATSKHFSWSTSIVDNEVDRDSSNKVDDFSSRSDGGFASLDGMLQWAIGNSDPMKLRETAHDVQRMPEEELHKRQMEIKELMEKLNTPSDAKLMMIAIKDLNNDSISLEDRNVALQELLILVEPIDNANDLCKMRGLSTLVRELNHNDSQIRTMSAWVIGKASQNNPLIQKTFLELGSLSKLMEMVKSASAEEAIKALYAVSSLIRNNIDGQELFYAESGVRLLQDIIDNKSVDIRLCKKALALFSDLADGHLENQEFPFAGDGLFMKSVVDLMAAKDLDLIEKTLAAIKSVLGVKGFDVTLLKDVCFLNDMLEKVKRQLENMMMEESQQDYAADVEVLRREVEVIFSEKLRIVIDFETYWNFCKE